MKTIKFLGIDLTPRKALRAEITRLEREAAEKSAEAERWEQSYYITHDSLDLTTSYMEIYRAKVVSLAEGKPVRDRKGRFTTAECCTCAHEDACPFYKDLTNKTYCYISKE